MGPATAQLVRERAGQRCEYCRLPQEQSALRFHIEHIVARQHGGWNDADNLALACPECNYRKGTNLTGIDPDTGKVTPLFHPRRDRWEEHFVRVDARIVGRTPRGRTTVWLLEMNTGDRLRWRELLRRLGLLEKTSLNGVLSPPPIRSCPCWWLVSPAPAFHLTRRASRFVGASEWMRGGFHNPLAQGSRGATW